MFLKKMLDVKDTLLFRLTVFFALAFIAIASIGFLVFYYRIHSVTMTRLDEELLEDIVIYTEEMSQNHLDGVIARLAEDAKSEDPREEFYRVIDFSGNQRASSNMSPWGSVDQTDALAKLKDSDTRHVYHTVTIADDDEQARMISAVIGPDTVLQIGESLEEADEYLEIFQNLFAMLIAILVGVATVIGWLLARWALTDVNEITRTAEVISKGAYDERVRLDSRFDEIKKLSATFNDMLNRIANLLKSMKEINDNIAHDLRSPLARIRGIAEMTLRDENSINDYKDMAVSTIEECDSLIEMINTMLDITEAEAGVNDLKTEEFELIALISEACELFRPMADEKQITLKAELPESLTLFGDRKKMQRIVTNLLENAIKYTPERGIVTVSAAAHNGDVKIDVNDTGVGIASTDLPRIFERFYRCDQSRSQGGVGLGLSLAKAYAQAMNGSIDVNSTLNQGSTFTLRFRA